MDNAEAVKIAQSCLDGVTTPLAAGRSLCLLVGPPNPIWDEMGGAHGPLSSFYVAADEADWVYFLGSDVERWHPNVREIKRIELEEAEMSAARRIRAACQALIDHVSRSGNALHNS